MTLGISIEPLTPEMIDQAIEDTAAINGYLSNFCSPGKCPSCESPLGGLLGMFRWVLNWGEGECAKCGYPVRGHHDMPNGYRLCHVLLPYHPSILESKEATNE